MGISVELSGNLQAKLESILAKYPQAANRAAVKAGFQVQKTCVKEFLNIGDGIARSTKTRRATKRTTWPGLRNATGNLARHIKVGVYNGLSFETITSENSAPIRKSIISGVAVGVSDDVPYGVIHEREGRKQGGRNEYGRNYYPFLEPAMKASEKEIEQIFNEELKAAERK